MKQPERGLVVAAKYTLEKPLGRGAMGEVWAARHLHNGRRFALKLLKAAASESAELRGRLEREARLVGSLTTPHIAQVTDSGLDEDGDPYVVLELLEGEDLHRRLRREERLPLAAVVRIAAHVGKALRAAHGAGLVHRDLKPANIFLARQDDEEIVKVLDFGIAKSLGAEVTEYTATGALLGTASYMSPEHVRDAKSVDHRADLWAFAVVLFRALTGEMPFEVTGFDLYVALGRDPIPAPIKATSLVPGLPPPLDVFFERAFTQDIERRYPSATALVEGFCRAAGVPSPARSRRAAGPHHGRQPPGHPHARRAHCPYPDRSPPRPSPCPRPWPPLRRCPPPSPRPSLRRPLRRPPRPSPPATPGARSATPGQAPSSSKIPRPLRARRPPRSHPRRPHPPPLTGPRCAASRRQSRTRRPSRPRPRSSQRWGPRSRRRSSSLLPQPRRRRANPFGSRSP